MYRPFLITDYTLNYRLYLRSFLNYRLHRLYFDLGTSSGTVTPLMLRKNLVATPDNNPFSPQTHESVHNQSVQDVIADTPNDMPLIGPQKQSKLDTWQIPKMQPKIVLPSPRKKQPIDITRLTAFKTRIELQDILDKVSNN